MNLRAAVALVTMGVLLSGCGTYAVPVATAYVTARLPASTCPTAFSASAPLAQLPRTLEVRVPSRLAGSLEVYGNQANYGLMLGPRHWRCTASSSSSGIWMQLLPSSAHGSADSVRHEALTMNLDGGCMWCRLTMVCPYFEGARRQWSATYVERGQANSSVKANCTMPHHEAVVRVSSALVRFADPPGTRGAGIPSGGPDPSVGLVYFSTSMDSLVSCTLPDASAALCGAVLGWFAHTQQGAHPSTVRDGRVRPS